jgi:chemotaxis protein methyltransferase CheR
MNGTAGVPRAGVEAPGAGDPRRQPPARIGDARTPQVRSTVDRPTTLSSLKDSLSSPRETAREFEYSPADFEAVRALIHKRAGISLSAQKSDMVYSRLARRLRARGMRRFSDYLDYLRAGGDDREWEAFTNALTTNLTYFFREEHHFPMLADHLLTHRGRPLSIWCCAASTGEEPYSIAMTAVEAFGGFDAPVRVLATDLDTGVLDVGRRGVYPVDRIARLSAERVSRFFTRGQSGDQKTVTVRPELARLVTFRQINLLSPIWPTEGRFDAVFCRNVMIYFDKPTQASILRRFVPLMHPDALLFVGHSESLFHVADAFRLKGRTVYELTGRRAAA